MIKWLRIEESLRIGHTGIGYHRDFQPFYIYKISQGQHITACYSMAIVTKIRNQPKSAKTTQNDPKPPTKPAKTTYKTNQNDPKPATTHQHDRSARRLRRRPSATPRDHHADNHAWNPLDLIVFLALKLSRNFFLVLS